VPVRAVALLHGNPPLTLGDIVAELGWALAAPAMLAIGALLFFAVMTGAWNPLPAFARAISTRYWAVTPAWAAVTGGVGAFLDTTIWVGRLAWLASGVSRAGSDGGSQSQGG